MTVLQALIVYIWSKISMLLMLYFWQTLCVYIYNINRCWWCFEGAYLIGGLILLSMRDGADIIIQHSPRASCSLIFPSLMNALSIPPAKRRTPSIRYSNKTENETKGRHGEESVHCYTASTTVAIYIFPGSFTHGSYMAFLKALRAGKSVHTACTYRHTTTA